jgi:hypothetical protein
LLGSKHKRKVIVAEPVSDIDSSVDLGVKAVIGVVAGPKFVSDYDN